MKDPAFLFYSQDFIVGTNTMSFEDRGKYITILSQMHQQGRLDDESIRLLVGNVSVKLKSKFKIDKDGFWYNERLEIEIQKRQAFVDTRRENGKKGGRPKKPNGKPNGKPNAQPTKNLFENEIENVIEYYNTLSFSKVVTKTEQRKKYLTARLAENGYEKVISVFKSANESDFLKGSNDRSWKADFDWIINPNNFAKILEGKYVNRKEELKMI